MILSGQQMALVRTGYPPSVWLVSLLCCCLLGLLRLQLRQTAQAGTQNADLHPGAQRNTLIA